MKKHILIIEDEKLNADRLKRMIADLRPNYSVVTTLESVSESVQWLTQHESPQLVMMDIKLADGLSFEIFNQVELQCPIIFTTAYDEYAVQAFKHNSVDYLLKPVEKEELEAAFAKLEHVTGLQQSVETLLSFVQRGRDTYRSRFLLPYRDGYKTLLLSDIQYFYSAHKLTYACLYSGAEEVLPQTLEELEQQLDPRLFFRANRQFIVHIDGIDQVLHSFNGKLKLKLKKCPDVELLVSREKAPQLKAWLDF